jgi:serine/threonine-protein kinase
MEVTPDVVLKQPLCQGGMGSVWVAEHRKLRTEVAVKFIAASLANDPSARARFEREATSASRTRSPHVVQTLDYGVSPEGHPFIVMELLEGSDLRARLRDGHGLPCAEVVAIARQVAHALGRAHEQGIVHRDLKPANVFLCDSARAPFVKLLDFGIAKDVGENGALTTTGMVGTPFYMSPEQLTGEGRIDHRCDVWALGIVVFEMLTGQRPYGGVTASALALAIYTTPVFPSARAITPSLPESIDHWFRRACARNPEDRFGSAAEAARMLELALGSVPALSDASDAGPAMTSTQTDAFEARAVPAPIAARQGPGPGNARSRTRAAAVVGSLVAVTGGLVAISAWSGIGRSTARPGDESPPRAEATEVSAPRPVSTFSTLPAPPAEPPPEHKPPEVVAAQPGATAVATTPPVHRRVHPVPASSAPPEPAHAPVPVSAPPAAPAAPSDSSVKPVAIPIDRK